VAYRLLSLRAAGTRHGLDARVDAICQFQKKAGQELGKGHKVRKWI